MTANIRCACRAWRHDTVPNKLVQAHASHDAMRVRIVPVLAMLGIGLAGLTVQTALRFHDFRLRDPLQ